MSLTNLPQINGSIPTPSQPRYDRTPVQQNRTKGSGEVEGSASLSTTEADPNAKQDKKQGILAQQLQEAVDFTNRGLAALSHSLLFSIDKDTDKMVVKVVDVETDKVIKQIPSEEMLEVVRALDKLKGMLLRETA